MTFGTEKKENKKIMRPIKIIIHVGSDKAGSTTLQDCCYANAEALAKQGILYPSTGIYEAGKHHKLLTTSVVSPQAEFDPLEMPHIPVLPAEAKTPNEYGDLLRRECEIREARTLVLSSEALFHCLYDDHALELFSTMLPVGPVTVVVFLRNISDYVKSRWAHQVRHKAGFRWQPEEFAALLAKAGQLDFIGRLETFERVFGQGCVRVVWFDEIKGRLVDGLWRAADLPVVARPSREATPLNVRPSWCAIRWLFAANAMPPRWRRRCRRRAAKVDALVTRLGLADRCARSDPFPSALVARMDRDWDAMRQRIEHRYVCLGTTSPQGSR